MSGTSGPEHRVPGADFGSSRKSLATRSVQHSAARTPRGPGKLVQAKPFWLNLSLNRLSRIPNCHGSESQLWQPGSDAGGRAAFDKGGEGGDTLGWHRSPLPAPSSAAALVGPAWWPHPDVPGWAPRSTP